MIAAIIAKLVAADVLYVVERHAHCHGTTVADVIGRGRTLAVCAARHAAWAEIRRTTSLSYPEIGALFGCDHSTVMAGIRKARRVVTVTDIAAALRAI